MKRALFVLVGITCLAATPAFAEEAAKPAATAASMESKSYLPHAGLWELQLDGPAFPMWQFGPGYNTTRGVGVLVPTQSGGSSTVTAGIGGSLGYLLSDMIEVGGMIGFQVIAPSGGSTVGFNLEPFLKLHLGSGMMGADSRINPFALIGVGLNITAPNGADSITLITPELAGGVEFMLTHSFGITVYIPITATWNTKSGGVASSAVIGLGLGYGLVGYF